MIQEITTALTALKSVTDIAKGLSSLRTDVEIKTKTSELLNVILDLQTAMLGLQSRLSELQEENTKLKQQLNTLQSAASHSQELAFRNKLCWKNGDKTPFCPTCWEDKKKQIHLDGPEQLEGMARWYCNVCQNEIYIE